MRSINRVGVTLVELVITVSILALLASMALPLSQMVGKRTRELELRRNLRTIRTAIDAYKSEHDEAVRAGNMIASVNRSGYPVTLEILVTGDTFGSRYQYRKRFLRRIPVDPMNPPAAGKTPLWGLRSYADNPDTSIWGREDVYDIHSESDGVAIDGSSYRTW